MTARRFSIKSFGQTEDEGTVLAHQVSGHRDATADNKDQLSNTDARVERIVEEIIDVHIEQVMKKTVEAAKVIPQDKVQNCTVDQIVAVPVPRIRKEIGEVIQHILQERISHHVGEQTIEAPVPQIREHCAEAMNVILLERLQLRTGDQIVDASVPQDGKMTVAETDAGDQPGVLLRGLESEGAVTKDNSCLSKFRLDGIQTAPRGAPEIEVTFNIDAKEVLRKRVQDKSTKAQQERQPHRSQQQHTVQGEKERKEEKRKREEQREEEKDIGKVPKKKEGKGERKRRDIEGSKRGTAKEKKDEEVENVAMDAPRDDNSEFEIFVKVDE